MFLTTQVRQNRFSAGWLPAPAGAGRNTSQLHLRSRDLRLPAQGRLGLQIWIYFRWLFRIWFFFGFFGCCKLALFCYKKTLLLWFQRIVKVSLLCLQSQYCLLLVPADLLLDPSFHHNEPRSFNPCYYRIHGQHHRD